MNSPPWRHRLGLAGTEDERRWHCCGGPLQSWLLTPLARRTFPPSMPLWLHSALLRNTELGCSAPTSDGVIQRTPSRDAQLGGPIGNETLGLQFGDMSIEIPGYHPITQPF